MSVTLYLHLGDCVEVLKGYEDGSIGAVVSDPPYGLEFMGKEWDRLDGVGTGGASFTTDGMGKGFKALPSYSGAPNPLCLNCGGSKRGRDRKGFRVCRCDNPEFPNIGKEQGHGIQEWHARWLNEAFRVLRPGGVIKAFSGTRTYHRMAAAMQESGFEGLRVEAWCYGSGFPKSMNIGKALDKAAGVDAEKQAAVQAYLREAREAKGMSKREVDVAVFCGTTRYGWVEGRGGARANEVYLPTPEEWEVLKGVLDLDDRFDAYIKAAIPSRKDRFRADGGKAIQLGTEDGDWGYQQDGDRWRGSRTITAPATEAAQRWDGWGTALKPSWEPVIVGRKPA